MPKKRTQPDRTLGALDRVIKEERKAVKLLRELWDLGIVKAGIVSLIIFTLFPYLIFFALKPRQAENINYGITFSQKYASDLGMNWQETYTKILDDLGVKNVRLVAYWDQIESTNNTFNFSDVEWLLEESRKRDVKVIMSIGRKVPRYPECHEPQWWKDIDNEEIRNLELYEYVKTAVERLKGYENIRIWQVENEPFFPFGECIKIRKETVESEIGIVRALDQRPILVQDSGEGGFWFPTYQMGDYLGISMYRKIWYDFWNLLFGNFVYFKYPLAHWTYKIKADLLGVPYQKIIVTELQAEPWGPGINSQLSKKEKDKSMSRRDFIETLIYAQKSGFSDLYLWGAEWWLWEKEYANNSYYWETARAIFSPEGR